MSDEKQPSLVRPLGELESSPWARCSMPCLTQHRIDAPWLSPAVAIRRGDHGLVEAAAAFTTT
eukprot:SAG31_NODE_1800_length_7238_cov_4.818602_2_plen_63_part_00